MIELLVLAKISAFRFHAIHGKYVLDVPGSWKSKRRHNSSGPWVNNVRSHSRRSQQCVAKVAQQFLLFTSVIPQLFWIRNIFFSWNFYVCNDLHIEPACDEMILFLLRHGHCLFVFYYSLFWYSFVASCMRVYFFFLFFCHLSTYNFIVYVHQLSNVC